MSSEGTISIVILGFQSFSLIRLMTLSSIFQLPHCFEICMLLSNNHSKSYSSICIKRGDNSAFLLSCDICDVSGFELLRRLKNCDVCGFAMFFCLMSNIAINGNAMLFTHIHATR
jgi:hypothetical protein